MNDLIILELSRDTAGNLGWILDEQLKSLKNLQKNHKDKMQSIIDDLQDINNSLFKQLKNGDLNEQK